MNKANIISHLESVINHEDRSETSRWSEAARAQCSIFLKAIQGIDESLFPNDHKFPLHSNKLEDAIFEELEAMGVTDEKEQDDMLAHVESHITRAAHIESQSK